MRKILGIILGLLLSVNAFGQTIIDSTSKPYLDTSCDKALYYPLGSLCQDIDDGKLYKGTGSAVTEVMSGTSIFPNATGIPVYDSNSSHYMGITTDSNITANRLLKFNIGDAARTFTVDGNPTLNDWFDQAVKAASTPTFAGLTVGATGGTIGSVAAGANLTLNATEGAELSPALTGASGVNWTFAGTYTTPLNSTIEKAGDGTDTITPTAATTIVAGTTYKVTITLSAWSVGSATYTLGGTTGQSTLGAATTYTDRVTTTTTDKLIITPTSTSRFTISAISILPYTDGTGDATIRGNLTVNSPATFDGGMTVSRGETALGANNLTLTGSIAATGSRVTKGWFTDLEISNSPTVGGTAISAIYAPLSSPTFTGSVILPSANADPAATAGSLVHDSTVTNFTNGALRYYNGAAIKQLIDMTAATAEACTEGQAVVYDATADLWKCGTVGGMDYPGAGIGNSTGSAWGTSYTVSGTGTVLAAVASPTFTGTITSPTVSASGAVTITLGTTGGQFKSVASTLLDAGPLGTRAVGAANSFGIPTFSSDGNVITVTDATTVYIAGVPVDGGANMELTNVWALYVAAGASYFAGGITGALTGNASTATLASTVTVVDSTSATTWIALFDSATGSLAAKTDAGLTYAATTGMLTATGFTGPLTGTASNASTLLTTTWAAPGVIGATTPAAVYSSPSIQKGPAIISSFDGTISRATTTLTFSNQADATKAGWRSSTTDSIVGTTVIHPTGPVTMYITAWVTSLTATVDSTGTLAAQTPTSVQLPIATFVNSAGVAQGWMNAAGNISLGTGISTTPLNIYKAGANYLQRWANDTSTADLYIGGSTTQLISSGDMYLYGGGYFLFISTTGNFGIHQTAFGTSAAKVLGMGSGTAPTTISTDSIQMWSADYLASGGDARLHVMGEASATAKAVLGSGKVSITGTTGGLTRQLAEATGTPSGTTTYFDITVSVPSGARLLGCQLRVDTALTDGETWGAAYVTGSTITLAAAGRAVAQNTKIDKLHVDEITTNTTNVRITRDAGNFTDAAGVIRAIVYFEALDTMASL